MKIIKLLLLIIVTLSVAWIGCSKIQDETPVNQQLKSSPGTVITNEENATFQTWTENFNEPLSLTDNWTLYGTPQPKWVLYDYGKHGLFDNNGPSPTKNYAVSNYIVGNSTGYTIEAEVMIQILNNKGTCICPGIAVSKELNPELVINSETGESEIATGISMRLVYAGINATWFPAKQRGHTWLLMEFLSQDETMVSSGYIAADVYSYGWHKLKMRVTPTRHVMFYCDNDLIWSPLNTRINPSMMNNKNIVLGYTSDGNDETRAGVAYHNWVKSSCSIVPSME
jgi:hypothetical protein